MTDVVTVFLWHQGRILLTRRGEATSTYPGHWAGISGSVEGAADEAFQDAKRELTEEVGVTEATVLRAGDPLQVTDADTDLTVHPSLFRVGSRQLDANCELAETDWVHPPAILERTTVPGLWDAYERVAPTIEAIGGDGEHGSSYLSLRALEVLRDTAAVTETWDDVAEIGRTLRDLRPELVAIANRINRVMYQAITTHPEPRTPVAVCAQAMSVIDRVVRAEDEAAAAAADLLSTAEDGVLTLSRSGTVQATIAQMDAPVVIAESRPGGEGLAVGRELADGTRDVTVIPDAAVASALTEAGPQVDAVVVGADAVRPDGSVVNKVGTRGLCIASDREGVPTFVVTARDKVIASDGSGSPEPSVQARSEREGAGIDRWEPLFDTTPGSVIDAIVTDDGETAPAAVARIAQTHHQHATWDEMDAQT